MNGREMTNQTGAKLMKARTQRNEIVKNAVRHSQVWKKNTGIPMNVFSVLAWRENSWSRCNFLQQCKQS